jgi:segregation and condensation protein A
MTYDNMPQLEIQKKNSIVHLLLNPETLETRKPWELDVEKLLETFLNILSERGMIDLRLAGTAALSSAIIYRLKVETLFFFERLRQERQRVLAGDPPTVLDYPFRYEIFSTSIEDLLSALQLILKDSKVPRNREQQRPGGPSIEPEPVMDPDEFLINIRKMLSDFKRKLANLFKESATIMFSKLTEGMNGLQRAQCFILMLFVANEGLLLLEQTQDPEDIRLSVVTPRVQM